MKPSRCRVMCPDCGRQKMLFETEKQALNFLKFNGDEVNPDGTQEMRVYYCPACCGYHISSKEYTGDGKTTERLINRYRSQRKDSSLQDSIKLYERMLEQNFTSRKEVSRWLKAQDQYSEATKSMAVTRFFKEYYERGIAVPGANKFIDSSGHHK